MSDRSGSPHRLDLISGSLLADLDDVKLIIPSDNLSNQRITVVHESKDPEVVPRGPDGSILERWKKCMIPSTSWTQKHTLYLTVFGFFIPLLLCFGVNFGVAVAIFRDSPPPTMWQFPIPLAGNYAAVIIVQTLINFPLVGSLSTFDILNGLSPSLIPTYFFMEMDADTWLGWFLQPPELLFPPIENKAKAYWRRLVETLKRSGVWIVLQFILVWPLFTGITYSIWGNDGYNSYPQPEFISATLGGILAMISCPIWALISMIHMGKRIEEESAVQFLRMDSTGGLAVTQNPGGRSQFGETRDSIPAPSPTGSPYKSPTSHLIEMSGSSSL